MVTVALRGRLGNNLFQYALGRLVAEHRGLELRCRAVEQPSDHPGRALRLQGPATLTGLHAHFPHAPLSLPGARIEQPVLGYELEGLEGREGLTGWDGHSVDMPRLLSGPPGHVRLDGYFQRAEHFAGHVDVIREWFWSPCQSKVADVETTDVLVSIRRGLDFGLLGWVLPLSYYDECLRALGRLGRVYLCGTGIDETVRAHFARYDPIVCTGTPLEDFQLMRRFHRVVLSNSTFAWWAAFLSEASEIYGPRSVDGTGYAFSGFGAVDLRMDGRRYHEVAVRAFTKAEPIATSCMAAARLHDRHTHLEIERPHEPPVHIHASGSGQEIVRALMGVSEVPVRALVERFGDHDVRAVMPALLQAGLVTVHVRYHEAA